MDRLQLLLLLLLLLPVVVDALWLWSWLWLWGVVGGREAWRSTTIGSWMDRSVHILTTSPWMYTQQMNLRA